MIKQGRELNAEYRRRQQRREQMRRDGDDMDPQAVKAFKAHFDQEWIKINAAFEAYDRLADERDADNAKDKVIKALGGAP